MRLGFMKTLLFKNVRIPNLLVPARAKTANGVFVRLLQGCPRPRRLPKAENGSEGAIESDAAEGIL
jgi:hypothetical protein